MRRIRALIKEPGKPPRHVHISDSLENLQRIVGGYIETVTVAEDLVIICDEEGRLKGKEPCCTFCDVEFVGTIVLCGVVRNEDGEAEFGNLPGEWKSWKKLFAGLPPSSAGSPCR